MAGNIWTGAIMVLFVVIINILVAFIQNDVVNQSGLAGCDTDDNVTSCQGVSSGSFLATLLDVSVTGLDGAPLIFNALYVAVLAGILVIGIIVFVSGFIPTVPG